jgi:hypothetical protein
MDDKLRGFGLALVEIPIAIGLGFAVFIAIWVLGCQVISRCYDTSGAGVALLGALGAVVGAGVFWFKVVRMGLRLRRRLTWDAVAIVLALAAYVLPQVGGWVAAAKRTPSAHVAPPIAR